MDRPSVPWQEPQNGRAAPYEKNLIASQLGITRESFSRALAELQKIGIEVQGETIIITNPLRLADACLPDPLIDTTEHILQVSK